MAGAGNGALSFHRRLNCRTATDARMVREHIRIGRKIEVDPRCPVRDRERVRVRNREVFSHKVLTIRKVPIKVGVTRSKTVAKHLFRPKFLLIKRVRT